MINRLFRITAVIALAGCASAFGTPMFTTTQGMSSTFGYGLTIDYATSDFLSQDSPQLCQAGQAIQFTTCTQNYGTNNDLVATDAAFVVPATTVSADSASTPAASNSYTVSSSSDASQSQGSSQASGSIDLSLNSVANGNSDPVSISPEPESLSLLALGVVAGMLMRRFGKAQGVASRNS